MKRSLTFLLALGLCADGALAQGAVGSLAPEIEAREWYNAPPATHLADLRGKVILLEFWAPW